MKTPLPKFPHHRGVPEHHFGVKTPLLATLSADNVNKNKCCNSRMYYLNLMPVIFLELFVFIKFLCFFKCHTLRRNQVIDVALK